MNEATLDQDDAINDADDLRQRAIDTMRCEWWSDNRVTATELAEMAASALDHPEWLDDETHWVWEIAANFAAIGEL